MNEDQLKRDLLLAAGLTGLVFAVSTPDATPTTVAQAQAKKPQPSPGGAGGQTQIRRGYMFTVERQLDQTHAPGLMYLQEAYGPGINPSTLGKFVVLTGRTGQYTGSDRVPDDPYSSQLAPDPNAPLTVFGQPNRFVYQISGPLVKQPLTSNAKFNQERSGVHAASTQYYQWQAPLTLVDLGDGTGTPQPYWNFYGDTNNVLTIQDETARSFAAQHKLPYPLLPGALTIQSSRKDADNIASLINSALTNNKNMSTPLPLAIRFNQ